MRVKPGKNLALLAATLALVFFVSEAALRVAAYVADSSSFKKRQQAFEQIADNQWSRESMFRKRTDSDILFELKPNVKFRHANPDIA